MSGSRGARTAAGIDLADFDFDLPASAIAQRARPERDEARLMHLSRETGAQAGQADALTVRDLPGLLRSGDLLVTNATRVLAARLRGRRLSGGAAEALLLEPEPGHGNRYRALLRLSGRLRPGIRIRFEGDGEDDSMEATVQRLEPQGEVVLEFEGERSPYGLGEAPLPPYIRRPRLEGDEGLRRKREDLARYQTVYARVPGAVAAPTAGLHLTHAVLDDLAARGVECAEVVLHVGAGTFRPLRPEDLQAGRLHAERYELPAPTADAIAATRERGGRVVAVGTTTTRVLESRAIEGGRVAPGSGETDLFLFPGRSPRVVDGLLTNFHLPRSSLLLLVAAFIGRDALLAAYRRAIAEGYRFYSYGDAMLIL